MGCARRGPITTGWVTGPLPLPSPAGRGSHVGQKCTFLDHQVHPWVGGQAPTCPHASGLYLLGMPRMLDNDNMPSFPDEAQDLSISS